MSETIDSSTPECSRCHTLVNLRHDTEHTGYCDSCAQEMAAQAERLASAIQKFDDESAVIDNKDPLLITVEITQGAYDELYAALSTYSASKTIKQE